jgi:hypothetical protein
MRHVSLVASDPHARGHEVAEANNLQRKDDILTTPFRQSARFSVTPRPPTLDVRKRKGLSHATRGSPFGLSVALLA